MLLPSENKERYTEARREKGVEHLFLSDQMKFSSEVNRLYKVKLKLVKHTERWKQKIHTFSIPWI
jgi:hypothetical protein